MFTSIRTLESASLECLHMIGAYYDLPTYYFSSISNAIKAFRDNDIILDRVVQQHRQLLDIDQSMRQDVAAMRMETQDLKAQLLFEDTKSQLMCILRHNTRLRLYGGKRCNVCSGTHMFMDITIVRVWPKSVSVILRMGGHAPQHARLKMNEYCLTDENLMVSLDLVDGTAQCLSEFDRALDAALLLPPALNNIVMAYTGINVFSVDHYVEFEPE